MNKPTKVKVSKHRENLFVADPVDLPGSPRMGFGATFDAALGDFLRCYQKELGITIEVDASAQPAEDARRKRAMAKR